VGVVILSDHWRFGPGGDEDLLTTVNDAALLDWKTGEGIGLGSSEKAVLRTYGKPPAETTSISQEHGAEIETKTMTYTGRPEGIGLGSSVEDVLRAYGEPPRRQLPHKSSLASDDRGLSEGRQIS
jgi:hypothetical protein